MHEALFSCNTVLDCTVGGRLHVVMGSTCRRWCRDERRSAKMSRPTATYLHAWGRDGHVWCPSRWKMTSALAPTMESSLNHSVGGKDEAEVAGVWFYLLRSLLPVCSTPRGKCQAERWPAPSPLCGLHRESFSQTRSCALFYIFVLSGLWAGSRLFDSSFPFS